MLTKLQRQGEVITAKINGTCTWVLKHPDYVKWLSDSAGLLWVQGTPGAGKSTVMKFIVDDMETRNDDDSTQIVASYFFHGRGTAIQKAAAGLYRSLLHQLLTKMPQYLAGLTERFEERCRQEGLPGQDWTWGEEELRDRLASIVLQASRRRPITLCVDALDECGSDAATSLVLYARNLVSQAQNSGCRLRICFACRYYPSLNSAKSNTICVEKQNSSDIRSILDTVLQGFADDSRIAIAEQISERANGVFQWAVLVASQALKLQSQGARRQVIQKRIEGIPVELHRLYAELLSKVPEEEHGITLKLFQWLCFSQCPLTATQLRHVMAIDAAMPHQSIAEYQDGDDFADDLDQLEIKVNHLSKGLVQIINSRAQFIHQSVSDYLLQCGLQNLQRRTGDDAPFSEQSARGLAHFEISRSCIRYLTLREVLHYRFPESPRKQDRDQGFNAERVLEETLPLARYAIFSIPWHIAQVEAEGVSQQDLLGLFQWPSDEAIIGKWADLADVVDFLNNEWRFDWPVEGSRLIHLLCELGISSAFEHILNSPEVETDGRLLDPGDAYHRTPLYHALIKNHDQIVQQLLSNEDVEIELLGPSSSSTTSLHIAVERRDIPLIKRLLELGMDVDISDEDGKTPMAFALEREDIEIAKMLFAAGAGKNESYGPQGTIVHYAVRKENMGLLRHVLAGGVMVNSTDVLGRTPLFHAVVSSPNRQAMIQELLAAGGDPQIADIKGETPLHYAVDTDDEGLLSSLLASNDATLPRRMSGESPLLRAAKLGKLRMVQLLLSNRFVPDIQDTLGRKALEQAATLGSRAAVLSILRSDHIDPNDAFAVAISIRYFDFAQDLLASGVLDLDPGDAREVPLHAAAISGEVNLVQMLFEDPRTNPNRRHRRDGKTALYMAVESSSVEVVMFLLDNVPQVDPDLPTFAGQTPLLEAARGKRLDICKRLLCTGRVSATPPPDRYDMTPLCAAAISGAVEVVQYLLSRDEIRRNEKEVVRAVGHANGFKGIGNAARERIVTLLNKAYYGNDIE
ncbi:hypothetical protein SLS55_003021 [Diplodia seriata]|uniref:Nephrocystin 3-like N-terminal domain-containing protein n=1 Tax=Diplodia seriata TaxID=420778 RepID=A0ABR3CPJ5_9PEZI